MTRAQFELRERGTVVRVRLDGAHDGARSEVLTLLLSNGGRISAGAVDLSRGEFARIAIELALTLRRLKWEAEYDEYVGELLIRQRDEVVARRDATTEVTGQEVAAAVATLNSSTRVNLERELTPQQAHNLARLRQLSHGANFSVPGAGKTTTALALYESLKVEDRVDQLLVVAPKNAFVSWESEVEEFYLDGGRPEVVRLVGGVAGVGLALERSPEIALITYQMLSNVLERVAAWAGMANTHVILDESHRAKAGESGLHGVTVLELAPYSTRRDILSGTPLPHSAEDLRAQFGFLWPGQRLLPDERLAPGIAGDVLDDVEQTVRPLYVRTTKDELGIPDAVVKPEPVALGERQRELYELLRSEAARSAAGLRSYDRSSIRRLGRHVVRMIEAASNPALLASADQLARAGTDPGGVSEHIWMLLREIAQHERPAKIRRAVELAGEVTGRGDRVLIWTGFVANIHLLERELAEFGPVSLHGEIPTGDASDPETREGRIRRFHEDDNCRVMIANPAAAGEGISLHRTCHDAVYVDRSFNAAHFVQSVDRIHRLGSEHVANVTVLEAADTIDARIASRLKDKIETMAHVLRDDGLRALAYDPEDVVDDFGGGIDASDVDEIIDHLEHSGDDE